MREQAAAPGAQASLPETWLTRPRFLQKLVIKDAPVPPCIPMFAPFQAKHTRRQLAAASCPPPFLMASPAAFESRLAGLHAPLGSPQTQLACRCVCAWICCVCAWILFSNTSHVVTHVCGHAGRSLLVTGISHSFRPGRADEVCLRHVVLLGCPTPARRCCRMLSALHV